MRTIKRYSLPINKGKWEELVELARLYRDEKNFHLLYYNMNCHFISDKSNLDQQIKYVKAGYRSPFGLQARQWKIAQKDAYQTTDKYWCALAAQIKTLIAGRKAEWSDAEMHYAYWLIYNSKRLAELIDKEKALEPEHFCVSYLEKKRVRNYLRRVVRRKSGNRPVAKRSRSFALDSNMYALVENSNDAATKKPSQFIKIMGLTKGERIVVPLTGYANFSGNIRVVLDFYRKRFEIHTTSEVNAVIIPEQETVAALDAGISEVFTDENGTAYEPTFGKTITQYSEKLNKTGKVRNKAHALAKKSSKHKAHRIRKYNLGKKKMRDRKRKGQVRVKQQISHAIHAVCEKRQPTIIVTERLDIRGRAKSKKMSRLVSYWMRSALKERLDFLALVEGFHHKQVNPAYSSQTCPTCLFVHKNNRRGDIFKCLNCGYTDHADRVAAINLKARANDPDIPIYTPKSVVRSILQKRFVASLQKQSESTIVAAPSVSGRIDVQSTVRQSETPLPNSSNGHGTETSPVYI
jgi:IS605 OrfB family transposase